MKNLKFEDLPRAIEEVLQKLVQIEKELTLLKESIQLKEPKEQIELMTRKETVDFLRISLPTLYHWTKAGILKSYGLGNRVYYRRSEVVSRFTGLK